MLPLLLGALLLALPVSAMAAEPEPETGNITGIVTDEAAAPLAEVEVCAKTADKSHFKCDLTRNGGSYEITNLPLGEYKVGFWDEAQNFVIEFWDGASTWNGATPVNVTPGTQTLNVSLVHGAVIEGTVTATATGEPVGEVEACAMIGELERCGTTNGAGEYVIDGLVEGTWSIYFYAMKAKVDVVSQPYAAGGGFVTVGPKQVLKGVNEALIPGGQIAGTVRNSGGAPLGGVLVCVTTEASSVPLGCLRTPASGAYRFTRVWPGSFKVAFSPEPKELFGPEHLVEAETMEATEGLGADSYPTQWWSGQSSFDAATPIEIAPPQIFNGVDASLVAPAAAAPPVTSNPAPVLKKPLLKCKRGFVKRKVHGKQRCVKRHAAKPKPPRHKRHKPKHQAPQSSSKRR